MLIPISEIPSRKNAPASITFSRRAPKPDAATLRLLNLRLRRIMASLDAAAWEFDCLDLPSESEPLNGALNGVAHLLDRVETTRGVTLTADKWTCGGHWSDLEESDPLPTKKTPHKVTRASKAAFPVRRRLG